MKKQHVKIGCLYTAKISGTVQVVRVQGDALHGGWWGLNIMTDRRIKLKTAQKLRQRVYECTMCGNRVADHNPEWDPKLFVCIPCFAKGRVKEWVVG